MGWDRTSYMRIYTDRLRKRRREVVIAYLGGACAKCGSTVSLEFDHKDPNSKVDRIANLWTASSKTLWAEVDKCQLLCHWCHKEKHSHWKPDCA